MISGNPLSESEEMIYAIRDICPEIGIIKKNGEIILTGREIERLKKIRNVILRINRIDELNKYGTMALLEIKDKKMEMADIRENNRGEKICVTA